MRLVVAFCTASAPLCPHPHLLCCVPWCRSSSQRAARSCLPWCQPCLNPVFSEPELSEDARPLQALPSSHV